jgi:hypothetical protein
LAKSFDLSEFPKAFEPLVVVVGDRREGKPETIGDVLAYSVSAIDLMFLPALKLPEDTPIVSDKIFVIESEDSLKYRFRDRNILTIGSPAVNLFSRRIDNQSFFRFDIDEDAKKKMARQANLLEPYKVDMTALGFYIAVAAANVQTEREFMAWAGRGQPELNDGQRQKFETIRAAVAESGLTGYKALLHAFGGSAILDPVDRSGHLNLQEPRKQGYRGQPDLDYGFVSLAAHPYADDKCSIYVGGMHGPGTAYGLKLLANPKNWKDLPYGGVFEVRIPIMVGFADRMRGLEHGWQTVPYGAHNEFRLSDLRVEEVKEQPRLQAFISMPMNGSKGDKSPVLQLKKEASLQKSVEWTDPYNVPGGSWEFATDIQSQFSRVDFVVHDITGLSPGVMFEVGYSRGLERPAVFLWDTRKPFNVHSLPPSLRKLAIDCVKFADSGKLCTAVSKRIKVWLNSPPAPNGRKKKRTQIDPRGVVIAASPRYAETLKKPLTEQLKSRNCRVIWKSPESLDELSGWMDACQNVIVATANDFAEGMLVLGLAQARKKNVLEFYDGNMSHSTMFTGIQQSWQHATVAEDVQSGLNKLFQPAGASA